MKPSKKWILASFAFYLIPLTAALIFYNQLPDTLPMHFNIHNQPDSWLPKPLGLFGSLAAMMLLHFFALFITFKDPKNRRNTPQMLRIVTWIIPVISSLVLGNIMLYSLDVSVDVGLVMKAGMGILFVIIGNYLPKCKQSYTLGIRTPWTLNSNENWHRTHRFAGFVWTFCGVLILCTMFFDVFASFFLLVCIMIVLPMIYSYLYFIKEEKNKNE